MANKEACEVYIEQEIKDGLKAGKKPYSIGKEISNWIEKKFEAVINPRTIEQRARRIEDATNVAKKSNIEIKPISYEQEEDSVTHPVTDRGGSRDGAGRPHVSQNSGDNEWYTPKPYIAAARAVMGTIDLDPASSEGANKVVGASNIFTSEDNGLKKDWAGKLWLNPPYASDLVGKFIEKLAVSIESGEVKEALVLVNNATETKWFSRLASVSSYLCFPTGRVKFWHTDKKDSAPLQGQCVAYIGKHGKMFCHEFNSFGIVVEIVK